MRASRGTSRSGPPAPSTPRGPARTRPGAPRRGAHAGPPADETPITLPAPVRVGLRPRTVRARIVAVLMVPVVSVMALWAFATVTAAGDVWDLLRIKSVDTTLRT